jgi:hypothetical protein
MQKFCLDVSGGHFALGSLLQLWSCQNSNPDQQFVYRNNMLVWAPLDGSGAPQPCLSLPLMSYPYT